CSKCVKVCPASAISLENDRIQIDQRACLAYGENCGMACVEACPRKILRSRC
ncbi:MAG: 4Fe-4S dicluster domain-containing protein, partial [Mailhella sp.]|nr:4Fe-4S dicluster domain-containing protein [Mailhella sp.]